MIGTAFIFPNTMPIQEALEAMLGPSQHDAHARRYHAIIRAYGDMAGWYKHKIDRYCAMQRLVDDGHGEWVNSMAKMHAAWSASRVPS